MKVYKDLEQRTDEWFHTKKGKITGTILKDIMGTPLKRKDAFYEIIAQRLTVGVNSDHESPMDRGTRLEPEAIAMFELHTGKQVTPIGFSESDDHIAIANSPDGLIEEENVPVEVKCPEGKNYVKAWLENTVPKEYIWQVVQYFVVNEKAEKLYFVLYNPDIEIHPLHIIEVYRKDIQNEINEAIKGQKDFLAEVDTKLEELGIKI